MKSSKSIERLFQESFKDFQASPSPKVWNGIEEKLANKKQSRRLLPIWWWKVASVAAILLIFGLIGAFYYKPLELRTTISSQDNPILKSTSNSLEVIPAHYRFSSVNENLLKLDNSIERRLAFQISESVYSEVTNTTVNVKQANLLAGLDQSGSVNETRIPEKLFSTVSRLTSSSVNLFSNALEASRIFDTDKYIKNKKRSLFDVIEEDELLAMEEDTSIDKPWAIQPHVAPVFMNSFNGGNPIEPSLQGKTSSNPNVSYGINLAYAINKKIKIRTGISQVAMGYNTQDVILSITSSSLRTGNSANLNTESNLIGEFSLISATNNANAQARSQTSSFGITPTRFSSVGAINHELGFVEVPLEVEYALIDKKIGVHLLGGASTYLLNNNEIFFEENGRSSSIGEADNLNTFSFSANLGVGLDYSFSERVSFNLEPKFLYQINTFQSNTDRFQPYFFGIYSGIKFKF